MNAKVAVTASIGSALEFYDYIIYGFFAHILSLQFATFHSNNILNQITFSSIIFTSGCLARPLGALIFGYIGDTQGRLKSLYYSMLLSGFSCIIIILTPSYYSIGIFSTIIFFITRILQSVSLGGSLSSSITYISEISTMKYRGFWISSVFMGVSRGLILASAVGSLLLLFLSKHQLDHWGWRMAFLAGLPIILTALYTKRALPESHLYKLSAKNHPNNNPIKLVFKEYKLDLLFGVGLYSSMCIFTTSFFFYLPTFLSHYGVSSIKIISVNACGLFVFSIMVPLFAWMGDVFGQRKLLLFGSMFIITISETCYNLLISQNLKLMCFGSMILGCITSMLMVTIPVIVVGQFPTKIRLTGLALTHNISYAIISGSTIFIIQMLSRNFLAENRVIPILMIISSLVSVICSVYFKPEHDFLVIRELREAQSEN